MAASGCLPFSMLQAARAVPDGATQIGLGLQGAIAGHKQVGASDLREGRIDQRPTGVLTVSLRHGLGDGQDFGVTAPVSVPPWGAVGVAAGLFVDRKWSWSAGSQTRALAPGVGLYFENSGRLDGHGESVTNRFLFAQLPFLIGVPLGDRGGEGPAELVIGPRLGAGLALIHDGFEDSVSSLLTAPPGSARPFATTGLGLGLPVRVSRSITLMPEVDANLAVHGNWVNDATFHADGLVLGRGNFTWAFSFGLGLLFGG